MVDDKHADLLEILEHVDPAPLSYQEWLNVGMALKDAGFTASDWDAWSQRDPNRYHPGECFQKWGGFYGSPTPVTSGTIVQLARDQGWTPGTGKESQALDWGAVIGGKDDLVVVDSAWIEGREVAEPDDWRPVDHLVRYLETLFEASENVGYVTESWEKDGRFMPSKGSWDRTAGELIQQLNQCAGDIGSVLGDYREPVGAWIRFNPLDGKGCKNENVTEYRYALVESDDMPIDQQNAIIRELELPVACLVHSGGKSLHAIVRIDAGSYDEYRKRVDFLYDICQRNGLKIDKQNRNPSRLSLIHGVLRQGHKLLLAGPSKAGKSYALIELCCAIAEGRHWLQWSCAQGRVLYVNLELDRASCLHRFRDVYTALGWQPASLANIDIWNLRGKSIPMDKLAPKLIRRAAKRNYIAIVIDPIYKVITGDENSADQMAHFCNQFDRVCFELGAAVIYCHHHSKGSQGQKRSMDRASGSGVFARDPDALLDLIELDVTEALRKQEENKAVCAAVLAWLRAHAQGWEMHVSQDDQCSEKAILGACEGFLSSEQMAAVRDAAEAGRQCARQKTGWRIEGTLREFPKFAPVNLWFAYPVHHLDEVGSLKDLEADGEVLPWQKASEKRKKNAKSERDSKREAFVTAVEQADFGDPPTIEALCDYLGLAKRTVEGRMKAYGYISVKGKVCRKEDAEESPPQP